jgi:hypothetical protein
MLQIQGTNNILQIDRNNNVFITESIPQWPASGGTGGGYYSVSFSQSAVTAASLAANTTLMSMRLSTSSQRQAYVSRVRIGIAASTLGAAATAPGNIGLQRFSGATPTGGVARVPTRLSTISGTTSDMTDIRDSNAALTVTSVVFGSVITTTIVPLFIASGLTFYESVMEMQQPIVLNPGEGIALRTQVVMPATQTWLYSYTFYWNEK